MRHRSTLIGIITAAAILGAACSSGDVSQTEYDQKVAELALAQQDLYDARDAVTTANLQVEAIEARIDLLVDQADVLLAVGDDPLDEVVSMIEASREEVLFLSQELETALESSESEPPAEPGANAQLGALLEVAAITTEWLRPDTVPTPEELANLADVVAVAEGEMVRLAFEALQAGYEDADADERTRLIADVNSSAIETARSLATAG